LRDVSKERVEIVMRSKREWREKENVRRKEERKTHDILNNAMEETISCNSYQLKESESKADSQRIRVVGLAVDHDVWSPHRPRRRVSGHVDLNNNSDGTVRRVRDDQF
jgi:hypothetical protein